MFKAERPGEGQANIFHVSSSDKLSLCHIGQNHVTWSLLAARESGTVDYVAEAGHIATVNITQV